MQAYGKRKRVTRPDADNARESYGVRTQRVPQEGISGKKCNGYRPVRTYGHGRTLTFRIKSMIYTTNWIERLACHEDVRGHAQRGIGHHAYGKTAMDKNSYLR